jgi:glutathione S-transferase
MKRSRLVTFPVSHFCEKARFALDFFGCAFDEDAHAPVFHKSRTDGNQVPTFFDENGSVVSGSDAIVSWARVHATKNKDAPESTDEELLALFDEMGVRVRQWAYFSILQDKSLTLDLLAPVGAVPENERWWLNWSLWLLIPLMKKGMNITEETAAKGLVFVEKVFDRVEAILEKQPFLSGEAFGSLDINFVSLASAIVCPKQMGIYAALYERFDEHHPCRTTANQCRDRRAGKHVLHCYETFRK